jgi:uncharacterized protein (TIGR02001 family)
MTRTSFPLRALVCSTVLVAGAMPAHAADAAAPTEAAPPAPPYTLTYHIDLVSRYYARGLTTTYGVKPFGTKFADAPESDKPTLQWGADFVHSSGIYLGYFGSQINYSYDAVGKAYSLADRSGVRYQDEKSIENDFYGGYNGTIGDIGYVVGGTYYYYINGTASNWFETKLGLTYGPFGFYAQTALQESQASNKGDTYWTLTYATALPYDVNFLGTLGFYTYKKEGKYLGSRDTYNNLDCAAGSYFNVTGCMDPGGKLSSGNFRHLTLGFTKAIPDTPITLGLQGIIGGKNRFDISQGERVVVYATAGF